MSDFDHAACVKRGAAVFPTPGCAYFNPKSEFQNPKSSYTFLQGESQGILDF
jgi:hypothetical protein